MLSQIAKIADQNPDRAKVIEGKIIGRLFFFERLYVYGVSQSIFLNMYCKDRFVGDCTTTHPFFLCALDDRIYQINNNSSSM